MATINFQATDVAKTSFQQSNSTLSPSRKESEAISQLDSTKGATSSANEQTESRSAQADSNFAYNGKTIDTKKKL